MDKKDRDFNKELLQLFEKATDQERYLAKENSFKKAMSKRRDVMVHIAVTITNRKDGHTVVGEKDNEICQFAVEIPASKIPMRKSWTQAVFGGLVDQAWKKMLLFGLSDAN